MLPKFDFVVMMSFYTSGDVHVCYFDSLSFIMIRDLEDESCISAFDCFSTLLKRLNLTLYLCSFSSRFPQFTLV